jgi:hypothetical protein
VSYGVCHPRPELGRRVPAVGSAEILRRGRSQVSARPTVVDRARPPDADAMGTRRAGPARTTAAPPWRRWSQAAGGEVRSVVHDQVRVAEHVTPPPLPLGGGGGWGTRVWFGHQFVFLDAPQPRATGPARWPVGSRPVEPWLGLNPQPHDREWFVVELLTVEFGEAASARLHLPARRGPARGAESRWRDCAYTFGASGSFSSPTK